MGFILAYDIGIASLGWAVIDRDSEKVLESGVNIFPEATAASNIIRREMRQGKRLLRRRRTRIDDFNKLWKKSGFPLPEEREIKIVETRVQALQEEITMKQLYDILRYYLKHRGISYLEDAVKEVSVSGSAYANELAINQNELLTKLPCQIQMERLKKYGSYRGETNFWDDSRDMQAFSNVFTIGSYRKEVKKILETQKKYHTELVDEFCDEYLLIFNRKRKYYEGPGNEKNRTDYGKYTTKIDNSGNYITEENIFEKLIGKCSIYPEEMRASGASYTAQEFNVLNDLNNLTVIGRKLEKEEKLKIIDIIKRSNTVNMHKIIEKVIGETIEQFNGVRVDKDGKEIFHKFEIYNKMRKELELIGKDIEELSREELDVIGHILTLNTDRESILEAFEKSEISLDESVIDCLITVRRKNISLFNKWHSFSLKIMKELIPEMYEQPKEQMTLLTEMGLFKDKVEQFAGLKYIPVDSLSDEIYNPVVRRAMRITFKNLNALLKKYGVFEEIIIEMPRDRNSEEEKNRIKDFQKINEKEPKEIENKLISSYDIKLLPVYFANQKELWLKLKLWNEQDGICLYSGKTIMPSDILEHPEWFEIDHIIPRSISFDDSRSNKVLVYRSENQKKKNQTPYYYLTHSKGEWSYEQYKATVMKLSKKKEYGLSRKKVQILLFEKDITKMDVLQGFINRNLNDTRYASRVVLNTLQSFFKAKKEKTKIKVIRGSFTHQMRKNMKLDKNREESYTHHAVDAMLIAYSQLGYNAYKKLQGTFIDFETGEILDERLWNENMSDDVYAEYLYGQKWSKIRKNIDEAEKQVKFWYKVDKKANRSLCNQTIYGTREYEVIEKKKEISKTYKISKLDFRTKDGFRNFKKLALDKNKREQLLVYRNDIHTFNLLLDIMETYKEATNPFVQYEKETGDYVRKYAKKHNGPKLGKLRYIDGEVGSCIDISHKYGYKKGSKKVILDSLVPYRMDVYYNKTDNKYYFVGIKQSDLKCETGKMRIDENAYANVLIHEKMIKKGQSRLDLEKLGFEFKLSFYRNDIIKYEKNGQFFVERFLSRTMPKVKNYIETKPVNKAKFDKQNLVGLSKTTSVQKYYMDILGNWYPCKKEEFRIFC